MKRRKYKNHKRALEFPRHINEYISKECNHKAILDIYIKKKIKLRCFKSSEHINEISDGPYRGFGYSSLFSDPLDLPHGAKVNNSKFETFKRGVNTKTSIIKIGPKFLNIG